MESSAHRTDAELLELIKQTTRGTVGKDSKDDSVYETRERDETLQVIEVDNEEEKSENLTHVHQEEIVEEQNKRCEGEQLVGLADDNENEQYLKQQSLAEVNIMRQQTLEEKILVEECGNCGKSTVQEGTESNKMKNQKENKLKGDNVPSSLHELETDLVETLSKDELVNWMHEHRTELESVKKKLERTERQLKKSDDYNTLLRTMIEKLSGELHRVKHGKTASVYVQVDKDDFLAYTTGSDTMPNWQADDHNSVPMDTSLIEEGQVADTVQPMADAISIADSIKQAAEAVVQQQQADSLHDRGYVYDENSGLYYHPASGYYYDQQKSLFYDPNSGTYYYYDYDSGTYVFHSQVELPSQSQTAAHTADIQLNQNTSKMNNKKNRLKKNRNRDRHSSEDRVYKNRRERRKDQLEEKYRKQTKVGKDRSRRKHQRHYSDSYSSESDSMRSRSPSHRSHSRDRRKKDSRKGKVKHRKRSRRHDSKSSESCTSDNDVQITESCEPILANKTTQNNLRKDSNRAENRIKEPSESKQRSKRIQIRKTDSIIDESREDANSEKAEGRDFTKELLSTVILPGDDIDYDLESENELIIVEEWSAEQEKETSDDISKNNDDAMKETIPESDEIVISDEAESNENRTIEQSKSSHSSRKSKKHSKKRKKRQSRKKRRKLKHAKRGDKSSEETESSLESGELSDTEMNSREKSVIDSESSYSAESNDGDYVIIGEPVESGIQEQT